MTARWPRSRLVPATPSCRLLLWCCAWLLLLAPRAYAGTGTVADFDGDGRRDYATISHHDPTVLQVWLSTTGRISIVRSREPVLHLAATDLDGDSRAELIAGTHSALHVWNRVSRTLRLVRIQQQALFRLHLTQRRASEPTHGYTELTAFEYAPVFPTLEAPSSYAPFARRAWLEAPSLIRGPTLRPSFHPFTPRPPPLLSV